MILADLLTSAQLFEGAMLLAFGVSWPISILKMLRTGQVAGKSPLFLTLVFCGYLCGVGAKMLRAAHGGLWPERVTVLYALNAAMVLTDLLLYIRISRRLRSQAEPAPPRA